jgi:hypothetical protein
MAGFGESLGWASNPWYKAFDDNRSALVSGFAGLGGARPGNIGGGFAQGFAQGMPLDEQRAERAAEDAQEAQSRNATVEYLKNSGDPKLMELAGLVEAGSISGGEAFTTAWGYQNSSPDLTADMQNFQFAQQNPDFAAFINGGGEAPQIVETYDPETGQPVKGYMQGGEFVPVGGVKAPAARDNPMNATIMKEIFEADEALQAGQAVITGLDRALELNNQAYDGPFADQRSYAASLLGDQGGIATQELKNVVTAQALESLKAVFGGMPTEGERKILLEIQGSVDQPKAVRDAIYRRARAAAERRIAENTAKAAALRNGSYFDGGYSAQSGAPAANTTSTGLQWSIEP